MQTPTLLVDGITLAQLSSLWMGLLYQLHTLVQFTNLIGTLFQCHGGDDGVLFKIPVCSRTEQVNGLEVGGSKAKKHMLGKKHVLTLVPLDFYKLSFVV